MEISKAIILVFFLSLSGMVWAQEIQTSKDSIDIDGSTIDYIVEGEGIPCLVIGSSVYYPKTFSKNLRNHLEMFIGED